MARSSTVLIDYPTPFAPVEEWEAFLVEVRSANEEDPRDEFEEAIAVASARIAELRGEK